MVYLTGFETSANLRNLLVIGVYLYQLTPTDELNLYQRRLRHLEPNKGQPFRQDPPFLLQIVLRVLCFLLALPLVVLEIFLG